MIRPGVHVPAGRREAVGHFVQDLAGDQRGRAECDEVFSGQRNKGRGRGTTGGFAAAAGLPGVFVRLEMHR